MVQKTSPWCVVEPMTDELLAKYESLVSGLGSDDRQLKDIMQSCIACVKAWYVLPDSKRTDVRRGPAGPGHEVLIQPLEDEHVESLWDVTPYYEETLPWGEYLKTLPQGITEVDGKNVVVDQARFDLIKAAFHLLWFATELSLDREPATQEKRVKV